MDALPTLPKEVTTGVVVVFLAFIAWQVIKIIYPLNKKKNEEDKNNLLEVIQRNATAMEKLSQSVEKNTAATVAGTDAIKNGQQREDLFTRMLVEVMRASGRAPETTAPSTTTTTTTKQQT